ncbi:short-chain dehydrogenase [Pollutimonas nitritireducens]|uniref:Short-chain dehydrogenase n=1 Tax=Pollutimonas nitritireducens TaxID=2045209 RepID=A0A2N4UHQ1_9BURK|nr:SDR family oxidoreductase [Pollutimonas nitritireducens]PLC54553.1 short-chain dehydrogenase [Pollutimonas nitritireducens]
MDAYDYQTVAGRSVLVTGAGRGLGAAICESLAAEGAHIIVTDINESSAKAVAERINASTGHACAFQLDVGDEEQVRRVLDGSVTLFGRLDAIVNNAGIDVTLSIRELTTSDWERVMRTNLTGPFLLAKYGLAHLAPGGHIVNIASTAARRAWPNASVYHASKWGLMGLSHALHAELRSSGIKVSAIIAGGMRTPFLLDRFPDIDQGTLQDPLNVARAVKFVLTQPPETVIPEVMVLPMKETSWP